MCGCHGVGFTQPGRRPPVAASGVKRLQAMHPILFRIPLPHMPLKLWWALAAVAAIAARLRASSASAERPRRESVALVDRSRAQAPRAMVLRENDLRSGESFPSTRTASCSALSLVVGWYLTLTLAERDGLPKETMANCYVITAIAAIVGLARPLRRDEPRRVQDVRPTFFALRRGGLVAYGGFLGGYLGSWLYLVAEQDPADALGRRRRAEPRVGPA